MSRRDIDLRNPPWAVTKEELERVERAAGRDSYAYQQLLARFQDYEVWKDLRDQESARHRKVREAKFEAQAQARADRREAERAADEATVREEIRRRFFVANPSASGAEDARLSARLYDDELMRRAAAGRDGDVEALRRHGDDRL